MNVMRSDSNHRGTILGKGASRVFTLRGAVESHGVAKAPRLGALSMETEDASVENPGTKCSERSRNFGENINRIRENYEKTPQKAPQKAPQINQTGVSGNVGGDVGSCDAGRKADGVKQRPFFKPVDFDGRKAHEDKENELPDAERSRQTPVEHNTRSHRQSQESRTGAKALFAKPPIATTSKRTVENPGSTYNALFGCPPVSRHTPGQVPSKADNAVYQSALYTGAKSLTVTSSIHARTAPHRAAESDALPHPILAGKRSLYPGLENDKLPGLGWMKPLRNPLSDSDDSDPDTMLFDGTHEEIMEDMHRRAMKKRRPKLTYQHGV